MLFSPYKLPNFLTKFPTEPEVNLSVGGIACSIREGFKKNHEIMSLKCCFPPANELPKSLLIGCTKSKKMRPVIGQEVPKIYNRKVGKQFHGQV